MSELVGWVSVSEVKLLSLGTVGALQTSGLALAMKRLIVGRNIYHPLANFVRTDF